jgi:hypothetical protein
MSCWYGQCGPSNNLTSSEKSNPLQISNTSQTRHSGSDMGDIEYTLILYWRCIPNSGWCKTMLKYEAPFLVNALNGAWEDFAHHIQPVKAHGAAGSFSGRPTGPSFFRCHKLHEGSAAEAEGVLTLAPSKKSTRNLRKPGLGTCFCNWKNVHFVRKRYRQTLEIFGCLPTTLTSTIHQWV